MASLGLREYLDRRAESLGRGRVSEGFEGRKGRVEWRLRYPSAWMSSSGFSRQRSLYAGAICAMKGGDLGDFRGYLAERCVQERFS